MITVAVLALLFLLFSALVFCGKGAWLIAGYNTMSEQEKEQYDQKKLCSAMGLFSLICCLMLCAMAVLGHAVDSGKLGESSILLFSLFFIAVILGGSIILAIYINKYTKKQ